MVHDNARVYFPFEITTEELDELRTALATDLSTVTGDDGKQLKPEVRDAIAREFAASYQAYSRNGLTVYHLYDTESKGQPRMGIASDTFHGDSGAPVFLRQNSRVVGVFMSGACDYGCPSQVLKVSWVTHESVLPLGSVIDRLDEKFPAWRKMGVVVKQ